MLTQHSFLLACFPLMLVRKLPRDPALHGGSSCAPAKRARLPPGAGRARVATLSCVLRAKILILQLLVEDLQKQKVASTAPRHLKTTAVGELCLAPCGDIERRAEDVQPCAILICSGPTGKVQGDLSQAVRSRYPSYCLLTAASLAGRRRGQSQGSEQGCAELTQCSRLWLQKRESP